MKEFHIETIPVFDSLMRICKNLAGNATLFYKS